MNDTKMLAHRIAQGRMPVAEALRCAMQLGEALRRIHDAGQVHGAVTPSQITIAATGAELLSAPAGSLAAITPYTAPEIVQGRPADARSDIFSFAAVVFEMLTGRRAFDSVSIVGPTPSSGSPAADRFLVPCLAKNPDTRTPRMQKVLLELKMLTVAARRAEAAANPAAARPQPGVDLTAIRAEMHQLETRIAAKVAEAAAVAAAVSGREPGVDAALMHDEMHQLETRISARVAEAATVAAAASRRQPGVDAALMHAEIRQLEARIADRLAEAAAAIPTHYESGIDASVIRTEIHQIESRLAARLALNERNLTEVQRSAAEAMGSLKDQLSTRMASSSETPMDGAGLETLTTQIDRIEKSLEAIRQHAAQFERSVAADLVDIEAGLKAQGASIESARTAMSQTDDLVERVVEALESLQTAVLDTGEPAGERANFAVN